MAKKQGIKDYFKDKFTAVSAIGSVVAAGAVGSATAPALGFGGLILGAVTGVATMFVANIGHQQVKNKEMYGLASGQYELDDIIALATGESDKLLAIEKPKQSHLTALKKSIEDVNMRQATFGDLIDPVVSLLTTCKNILSLEDPFNNNGSDENSFHSMVEHELTDTLEAFYNSSDPANNTEVRAKFKEQIEYLTAYTDEVIKRFNNVRDDKVDTNGNYLESKYGSYLPAISEQSS